MISMFLFRPRFAALAIMLSSALLLAAAFAFQYWGGLQPCTLCIWQRWPHAVVIGIAGLAFLVRSENLGRWLLVLAGVVLWIGAGIAIYHVGVEQHWWPGLSKCASLNSGAGSVDELLNRLRHTPIVACDKVTWSLFGLSMAGYNVLVSLLLGGWGFLACIKR